MMMKRKIILGALFPLVAGLMIYSCKDKGSNVTQDKDKEFHVKISVKDPAGNPVSGLRVSATGILTIENQLTYKSLPLSLKPNRSGQIQALTSVRFSTAANAFVMLTLLDLRGQRIDTLVYSPKSAGLYSINLGIPYGSLSGVYLCRLSAVNDSVHFQDSIYIVYHNPDPNQNVVGWTNQSGVFQESDINLFPHNLDLPMFAQTNSSGPEIVGTFEYTDSVSIVLTDTTNKKQQNY